MQTIVSILIFFIIFALVVISHEFGHLLIAKLNGISVQEFAVGMGPRICGFKKGGTEYVLRLIPLGGACIFEGDEVDPENGSLKDKADILLNKEETEDTDNKASAVKAKADTSEKMKEDFKTQKVLLREASVWKRIATVFAGPLFNYLLGLIFAIIIVGFTGELTPEIAYVDPGSPAEAAGLQVGDTITRIDGERVYILSEVTLINFINEGKTMSIEYKHNGRKYKSEITPCYNEEYGRYMMGFSGSVADKGIKSAFRYGLCESRYWVHYCVKSLIMLCTGKLNRDNVAGPVGMVTIVDNVIEEAQPYGISTTIMSLLNFATLISINLGVLNLLPLPALDGGRLLFFFVEVVRGKPVEAKKEAIVHLIGFILIIVLSIFIFYNDIARLFR